MNNLYGQNKNKSKENKDKIDKTNHKVDPQQSKTYYNVKGFQTPQKQVIRGISPKTNSIINVKDKIHDKSLQIEQKVIYNSNFLENKIKNSSLLALIKNYRLEKLLDPNTFSYKNTLEQTHHPYICDRKSSVMNSVLEQEEQLPDKALLNTVFCEVDKILNEKDNEISYLRNMTKTINARFGIITNSNYNLTK